MYKRSEVEKNAVSYFKDELTAKVWLDKYALKIDNDNFIESNPDDTIKRIARELFRIEQKYPNPLDYTTIHGLLSGYKKFVLGGSCLFGIGNDLTLSTLGNCFVVDSPVDSYGGIFKTDQELAQLMKRRGGVGVDLTTLRAKGSKVNNAASTSTGLVSFAKRFSNTTREVAQEGRRGALMLSSGINHEDIKEFITCKDDNSEITGANISVRVYDDFMEHLDEPENKKTWDLLIHQAWKNGEPGVLFWDKIVKESPADCYEDFQTITTNPCGELPLCAYDSCRLSAVNLFAYVRNPFTEEAYFDFKVFANDVYNMQKLMDDVVDLEREKILRILDKIEKDPEDWGIKRVETELWESILGRLIDGRRTGLGLMGLADTFAAMGLKYGSESSMYLAIAILEDMATYSYMSSIEMAKERGTFPVWDINKESKNPYINRVLNILKDRYKDYYNLYKKSGRRNIANLTIAPTGSISILAGVSSGIEPVFALSYFRRRKVTNDHPNKKFQDKQGDWWEEYPILHKNFKKFIDIECEKVASIDDLTQGEIDAWHHESPYKDSTAHEVNPLDKLKLQAAIQPFIDHSISATYNLPNDISEKQVDELYRAAWKLGLKGLTVYRDGSRDGVLNLQQKETKFNKYDAPKRPKDLVCDIHNVVIKGHTWKVFIGLYDDDPYEVFAINGGADKIPVSRGILRKVKKGRYDLLSSSGETIVEDITHNMSQDEEAFTRTISWALRHGAKLEFGIEQLNKSEGDITSFSKAIARTLKKYVKNELIRTTPCPDCGSEMISEGGCTICKNCGNTKCE